MPGSRAKAASRGRIQITQNYTPGSAAGQNSSQKTGGKKWTQEQNPNGTPTQMAVASPDVPMSKNNRANAQLAPLNHYSAVGQGLMGPNAENNLI